jgi:hypothetical protein
LFTAPNRFFLARTLAIGNKILQDDERQSQRYKNHPQSHQERETGFLRIASASGAAEIALRASLSRVGMASRSH